MDYAFILEDDPKAQSELGQCLLKIDKKLQICLFSSLEEFGQWMRLFLKEGPEALAEAGRPFVSEGRLEAVKSMDDRLVLVVTKNEVLGISNLSLIRKCAKAFVSKGACSAERTVPFVLTSFDNPDLDQRALRDPCIANVIFKPFDPLILTQLMAFAINRQKRASHTEVFSLQTTSVIEMLKDVELEHLSDVGFTTISDNLVDIGSLGKFYGPNFTSPTRSSVFAKCIECLPHPELKGQFRARFTFFGNNNFQISQLRRLIKRSGFFSFPMKWEKSGPVEPKYAILVGSDTPTGEEIEKRLKFQFPNLAITGFKSVADCLYELNPLEQVKKSRASEKAFGDSEVVTICFDVSGSWVFDTLPEMGSQRWLGYNESDLKGKDFLSHVQDTQRSQWTRALVQFENSKDKTFFVFVHPNRKQSFFVRLLSVVKRKGSNGKDQMIAEMREATDDEIQAHFMKTSTLPKRIDMVLMAEAAFNGDTARIRNLVETAKERCQTMQHGGGSVPFFLFSDSEKIHEEAREIAPIITNMFVMPMDTTFVFRGVSQWVGGLLKKENFESLTIEFPHLIKVASPIRITEISEAGLLMTYNRSLAVGVFRRFLLWKPNEQSLQEVLAICNYSEPVEDSAEPMYRHQFVFFSVTDVSLKQIRIWIRSNYIENKQTG